MADIKLAVALREGVGKNTTDKLRREKIVPAVYYVSGEENINVQVSQREFEKAFMEAGSSAIVDLTLDGKTYPVIIKDVQKHPYKNQYVHVDFQGVRMDETIRVTVPIVLVGRDEVRLQPSVLTHALTEVEVECLPAYIPQTAEVTVTDMQYDDNFFVRDLDIFGDANITIHTPEDELVASLSEPRESVEVETEGVDAADVPTVGETETDGE